MVRKLIPAPALFIVLCLHAVDPPSRGFPGLGIWVDDPPGTFACPLILDPHKPTVERQVVSDGILEDTKGKGHSFYPTSS